MRRIKTNDIFKQKSDDFFNKTVKRYQCLKCNKQKFPSSAAVVKHIKICGELLAERYKCEMCCYRAKHWTSLTYHTKKIHGITIKGGARKKKIKITRCKICTYTTRFGNMKRHLKAVHRIE